MMPWFETDAFVYRSSVTWKTAWITHVHTAVDIKYLACQYYAAHIATWGKAENSIVAAKVSENEAIRTNSRRQIGLEAHRLWSTREPIFRMPGPKQL